MLINKLRKIDCRSGQKRLLLWTLPIHMIHITELKVTNWMWSVPVVILLRFGLALLIRVLHRSLFFLINNYFIVKTQYLFGEQILAIFPVFFSYFILCN